jgi:hypothetical protein
MIKFLFLVLIRFVASIAVMAVIVLNYIIKGVIVAVRVVVLKQTFKEADEQFQFAESQVEILCGNLDMFNLKTVKGFGGKQNVRMDYEDEEEEAFK